MNLLMFWPCELWYDFYSIVTSILQFFGFELLIDETRCLEVDSVLLNISVEMICNVIYYWHSLYNTYKESQRALYDVY